MNHHKKVDSSGHSLINVSGKNNQVLCVCVSCQHGDLQQINFYVLFFTRMYEISCCLSCSFFSAHCSAALVDTHSPKALMLPTVLQSERLAPPLTVSNAHHWQRSEGRRTKADLLPTSPCLVITRQLSEFPTDRIRSLCCCSITKPELYKNTQQKSMVSNHNLYISEMIHTFGPIFAVGKTYLLPPLTN